MSVPAMKALSLLLRSTMTRISSSASARSQAWNSPSYISHVIALRWRARLNVTVRTGPSWSPSRSGGSVMIGLPPGVVVSR